MTAEVDGDESDEAGGTLYAVAGEAMDEEIEVYLDLAKETNGFSNVEPTHVDSTARRRIVLGGIGSPLSPEASTPDEVADEWLRTQAIPFNVENAVTTGVYLKLRARVEELLIELSDQTDSFTSFDPDLIHSTPYLLPVYQRLLNASSKSKLKELVGSVSDNGISKPAAKRIADILDTIRPGRSLTVQDLRVSIEPTLEGMVRDLVGRILLESIVVNALDTAGVPHMRESEYSGIEGVVYNFRADFVLPDADAPLAFIEVRKSSSRHASLYAKDKMFSAINWKGNNKQLMAILVTDGPWTAQTLQVMAKVFDYVVPLRKVPEMVEIVGAYLKGDTSKLKLLIDFKVYPP